MKNFQKNALVAVINENTQDIQSRNFDRKDIPALFSDMDRMEVMNRVLDKRLSLAAERSNALLKKIKALVNS